jgi:hypothetical protein
MLIRPLTGAEKLTSFTAPSVYYVVFCPDQHAKWYPRGSQVRFDFRLRMARSSYGRKSMDGRLLER